VIYKFVAKLNHAFHSGLSKIMKITSHLQKKIKHSIALLALGGLFLSYSTSAEAPLDIRVALVIGNAAYKNVPTLATRVSIKSEMRLYIDDVAFQAWGLRQHG
jgi:hypothetical protein